MTVERKNFLVASTENMTIDDYNIDLIPWTLLSFAFIAYVMTPLRASTLSPSGLSHSAVSSELKIRQGFFRTSINSGPRKYPTWENHDRIGGSVTFAWAILKYFAFFLSYQWVSPDSWETLGRYHDLCSFSLNSVFWTSACYEIIFFVLLAHFKIHNEFW